MTSITVKNLYSFEVDGSRVELELVKPGGIQSIEVKTEQFETRMFNIEPYLACKSDDPDHDPFRMIARNICIFATTGRHPTDTIRPEHKTFAGLGLMRAADVIRDMYEKEKQKV